MAENLVSQLRLLYSDVLSTPLGDEYDETATFTQMGGDSFKAIRLYQKCTRLGLPVPFQNILHDTIPQLASRILALQEENRGSETDEAQSRTGSWTPSSAGPSLASRGTDRHDRFHLLPYDYDFSRIETTLQRLGYDGLQEVENVYPCSPMQEDLYVAQRVHCNDDAGATGKTAKNLYQTRGLFAVPSWTTFEMVDAVWQGIVRRHEALRTVYVETCVDSVGAGEGRLLDAVVLTSKRGPVVLEDSCDDEKAVHARYDTSGLDVKRDYEHGVHHRLTFYQLPPEAAAHTLCQIDINHMVVDGCSLMLILDEFKKGLLFVKDDFLMDAPTLEPAPGYGQYIDYLRNTADEGAALDYWVDYLDGCAPCYFPTLLGDEDDSTDVAAVHTIDVPLPAFEDIRSFSHTQGVTLSTLLQTVWALTLRVYTGVSSVCWGYLSSGRSLPIPGTGEIVGPMMNLLVGRASGLDTDGGLSIGELLGRISEDSARASSHQTVSFGRVLQILRDDEGDDEGYASQTSSNAGGGGAIRGGGMFFDTAVTCYYAPGLDKDGSDEIIRPVTSHNASEFALVLKISYSERNMSVRIAYSTTTLSEAMVTNVAHTFAAILERLITETSTALATRSAAEYGSVVSPRDLSQITAWNASTLSVRKEVERSMNNTMCVHSFIEQTVKRIPTAPAIYAWDGEMDYQTLDWLATVLACFILHKTKGGRFVPLLFDKSKWFTVALLAVLKSGNAFVPLDPNNPTMRLANMLKQLRGPSGNDEEDNLIILCSRSLADRCAALAGNNVVLIVDDALEKNHTKKAAAVHLPENILPSSPAYVMFTSGSTGKPKGVVVSHAAYSYAAHAHIPHLNLVPNHSRVLQFASYGFDTSIEDHLSTLMAGGCLCVPNESARLSPDDLAAFTTRSAANWTHVTPTVARCLLESPERLPTMETVVLGGEPMTDANVASWAGRRLIQVYGPSECSVTTTVNPQVKKGCRHPANIGRALPGCAAWVVNPDAGDSLMPIGTVGELVVEGPILADGYLGQPDVTSEAFLNRTDSAWMCCTNNMAGVDEQSRSGRLYRSGDLVRYDSAGNLHYVGRKGSSGMVKIRGQRIETGEVERQLCVPGGVAKHAVVSVPSKGPHAGQLVCVVEPVRHEDNIPTSEEDNSVKLLTDDEHFPWAPCVSKMREGLTDRLPAYMIPEAWLLLQRMPRMPTSGKLDRQRVAAFVDGLTERQVADHQQQQQVDLDRGKERQGSPAEQRLRAVWAEVLNVPESAIGWTTSFFSLGGSSISAMMVSSLARERNKEDPVVTAAHVLRHRCIGAICKAAATAAPASRQDAGEHEENCSSSPFTLSPIQRLHFRASTDGIGDRLDQQTAVLTLTRHVGHGDVGHEALLAGLKALMSAHPMLRARFCGTDEGWTQRIALETDPRNLRFRVHGLVQDDYLLECVAEAKEKLDVTRGPLVAVDLFQEATRPSLLSITIHHLVVDTVSFRILLRQLQAFLLRGVSPAPERLSFRACLSAQADVAEKIPARSVDVDVERCSNSALGFWGVSRLQDNVFGDCTSEKFTLTEVETAVLLAARDLDDNYNVANVLSAALMASAASTLGRVPVVFIEGHGRDMLREDLALDATDTVAWFTTFAPVIMEHIDTNASASHLLPLIQACRNNSHTFFATHCDTFPLPMEAVVNFLGLFQVVEHADGLFQRCEQHLQDRVSQLRRQQRARSSRLALISVLASVGADGGLSVTVEWNERMRHQDKLRAWLVDGFRESLQELVASLGSGSTSATDVQTPCYPITAISPQKESRVRRAVQVATDAWHISNEDIETVYPCSPIQTDLMISQLRHGGNVYNQHFLFQVSRSNGTGMDPARVAAAWQSVVQRHAILRTVFVEDQEAGTFLQLVLRPETDAAMPKVDCACLQERPEELFARESEEPRPHPLSGRLLHSLKIYFDDQGKIFCLLSKNHLLTDGTTSQIIVRHLLEAYDSHEREQQSWGSDVPYSKYIEHVEAQDMTAVSEYWKGYLDGCTGSALPRLHRPLPADENQRMEETTAPRPRFDTVVSETLSALDNETGLATLLSQACRQRDLTAPVVFQSAWALVLATHLGMVEDVVFGVLVSGRHLPSIPGVQGIVGPMASVVPLRVGVGAERLIGDVCQDVQRGAIEHMEHGWGLSLGRILRAAGGASGEKTKLFNTILNIQKQPRDGCTDSPFIADLLFSHDVSEYDVALSITEKSSSSSSPTFTLSLEFQTSFLTRPQAERLLGTFQAAIKAIVTDMNNDKHIADVSLATPLDTAQLDHWMDSRPPVLSNHRLVHDMIGDTVRAYPDHQAIFAHDGEMTYAELDSASDHLATRVRRLLDSTWRTTKNDGPVVVVLCFEKSLWAVVSMLAVAKAGAAFVFVDPSGPLKRAKEVVRQTRALLGLSSARQRDRTMQELLEAGLENVLVVEESLGRLPAPDDEGLAAIQKGRLDPSSTPLYIIFTSGTTGTPKGVVINHFNYASAVANNASALGIRPGVRQLQFTNFCFDASLEETLTCLATGATVCIPSEEDRMSGDIAAFARRAGCTWAALTPSFLRTLGDPRAPGGLVDAGVQFLTVHAEPCSQALADAWAAAVPEVRPSYGPTECSVTSTVGDRFIPGWTDATNIGYPVGCRAWVVHPANHEVLVPVGAIGELLLSGPIVGQGYLGDAEKTARAFVEVHACWSPRLKMYKTGDLVRYAEDGSLLIMGRKDSSQVKVRGQRVELNELEHHLDACTEVRHAAALVPKKGLLKGKLVAVLSLAGFAQQETGSTTTGIRLLAQTLLSRPGAEDEAASYLHAAQELSAVVTAIEAQLPRYIVPEMWLVVEKLPVTQAAHKLDRQLVTRWVEVDVDKAAVDASRALLSQSSSFTSTYGSDVDEPTTEIEDKIRAAWAAILDVADPRQIPLEQTFFRLGGDSLDAIQVMRRCRAAGLQVTTQDVLSRATVRDLARMVADRESSACPPNANIEAGEPNYLPSSSESPASGAPRLCTPLQQRMYHAFHARPNLAPYLYNSLVHLKNVSPDAIPQLYFSWRRVVARHAMFRTTFRADDEMRVWQTVHPPQQPAGFLRITAETVGEHKEKSAVLARAEQFLDDTRKTLFLDGNPPVAIQFLHHGDLVYVHLVMSHILIDHVSLAHVFADWAAFYYDEIDNEGPTLDDALPAFTTYLDHIHRVRDISANTDYWSTKLRSLRVSSPCCLATCAGTDISNDMGSFTFTLSTTRILSMCASVGVTLPTALQFAWAVVLHLSTGQDTVTWGHLVSDRDMDETDMDIVGPMLAVVPGCVNFATAGTIADALRTLQAFTVEVMTHRTFDMGKVEKSLLPRSAQQKQQMLSDTLINYRGVSYRRRRGSSWLAQRKGLDWESVWKRDPHEQTVVLAFNEQEQEEGKGKKTLLHAEMSYYTGLMGREKADGLRRCFEGVLDVLVDRDGDGSMKGFIADVGGRF